MSEDQQVKSPEKAKKEVSGQDSYSILDSGFDDFKQDSSKQKKQPEGVSGYDISEEEFVKTEKPKLIKSRVNQKAKITEITDKSNNLSLNKNQPEDESYNANDIKNNNEKHSTTRKDNEQKAAENHDVKNEKILPKVSTQKIVHNSADNKENFDKNAVNESNILKPVTVENKENIDGEKIEQKLLEKGLISNDQLYIAQKIQKEDSSKSKMLGTILVELGFITEDILSKSLAEQNKDDNVDIKTSILDANLIKIIPKSIAATHKIIPIKTQDNNVFVATTDIYNIIVADKIRTYFSSNHKLKLVYAPEADITEAIDKYYGYETSIFGVLREIEEQTKEKLDIDGTDESYKSPTVRLVDAIFIDAIKKSASDIHFEPEKNFVRLRYRVDGELVPIISFHKEYWNAVVVRIKIISGLDIAETRKPQDGSIEYNISGSEIDIRVATHPSIYGENIVMRILDKRKSLLTIDKLGFSNHNEKLLKKMLKKPEGIVIVTGPTGSGKTTTLYSILNYINSISVNIMTLEDPVEYRLPIIRQSAVREANGMSFHEGIKSIMRQDPDIIFVGEVRDEKTASAAIRAAITGHQVYSTLHTNDAISSINRLIDIGIKNSMLSGSLICVIAQRLLRKLCSDCKTEYLPDEEECRILGIEKPVKLYKKNGCEKCIGTGYKGRVAAIEILPVDKDLDEIISTNPSRKLINEQLQKSGNFVTIAEDAIDKILRGVTDLDEVIRKIDIVDRL